MASKQKFIPSIYSFLFFFFFYFLSVNTLMNPQEANVFSQRLREGKKQWQEEFKKGRGLVHENFWRNEEDWDQKVADRQEAPFLPSSLPWAICPHHMPPAALTPLEPPLQGLRKSTFPLWWRDPHRQHPSGNSGGICLRGLEQPLCRPCTSSISRLHRIWYLETMHSESKRTMWNCHMRL